MNTTVEDTTYKQLSATLKEWVSADKLNWNIFSMNPAATNIFKPNMDKIKWIWLADNPFSKHILENILRKIDLRVFASSRTYPYAMNNPKLISKQCLMHVLIPKYRQSIRVSHTPTAIHMLENELDEVNWSALSRNTTAIHILKNNLDKVDWNELSGNPAAIHMLENNLDKVNWVVLSRNPAAIHILENNLDKVSWSMLSDNPAAIYILENNLDKVDWGALSCNTAAIHILENNLDKVDWEELSSSLSRYSTYDYPEMSRCMIEPEIVEGIMLEQFRPRNIHKFVMVGRFKTPVEN